MKCPYNPLQLTLASITEAGSILTVDEAGSTAGGAAFGGGVDILA